MRFIYIAVSLFCSRVAGKKCSNPSVRVHISPHQYHSRLTMLLFTMFIAMCQPRRNNLLHILLPQWSRVHFAISRKATRLRPSGRLHKSSRSSASKWIGTEEATQSYLRRLGQHRNSSDRESRLFVYLKFPRRMPTKESGREFSDGWRRSMMHFGIALGPNT